MEYTHVNPCAEDIYLFPSRKFLVRWLIGLDEEYWSENEFRRHLDPCTNSFQQGRHLVLRLRPQ
jgi:hypothetical protein